MTTVAFSPSALAHPPRVPLAAAWTALIRRPSMWWILVAWLVQALGFGIGLNYGFYVSFSTSPEPYAAQAAQDLHSALQVSELAGFGAGSFPFFGAATAVVLGALAVGYDYTHRTIEVIATQGPIRIAVLASQFIALTGLTGLYVAITYLANGLGLVVVAGVAGWPIQAPAMSSVLISVAASWLSFTAYAVLGATLAIVCRSATAALALGVVWTMAVETGIVMLGQVSDILGRVSTHTLAGATSNLAVARGSYPWWFNAPQETATSADGWVAVITLGAWIVACLVVAGMTMTRRDI